MVHTGALEVVTVSTAKALASKKVRNDFGLNIFDKFRG